MILPYNGVHPRIPASVYVAPGAVLVGDVEMGEECSVWFNTVIRGDVSFIRLGARTNVQDGSVLHVFHQDGPLRVAEEVTIGHGAVLQACTIGPRVLVGMNATVLDFAVVGQESIVAAGCVVPEGKVFPPGVLIAGVPGRVKRELSDEEKAGLARSAANYVRYARGYRDAGPAGPGMS